MYLTGRLSLPRRPQHQAELDERPVARAEIAADVVGQDAQLVGRDAEHAGELDLLPHRAAGAGVERVFAGCAWSRPCGTRSGPSWRSGRLAAEYQRRLNQACDIPGEAGGTDLERRIAALRRGLGRLIDGYAEGLIERGEFEPRINGMRRRLAQLEADRQRRLAEAETERNLILLVGRLDEFAEKVRGGLDGLDWNGIREIIRAMIRRVEVDGDHVNVVFRVPPPSPPCGIGCPSGPMPSSGEDWQDCRGRRHPSRRRDPARTERRMGCSARPLHNPGKHHPNRR